MIFGAYLPLGCTPQEFRRNGDQMTHGQVNGPMRG